MAQIHGGFNLPATMQTEGCQLIIIPTLGVDGTTGWTKAEVNAVVDNQNLNYIGVTLNDVAAAAAGRAHIPTYGLSPGDINTRVDWSKELFLQFVIARITAEATSPPLCYTLLKEANAAGPLAAHGLGIKVGVNGANPHPPADDRKLYGISYGAGAAEVAIDLSVTLTSLFSYSIGVHHKPAAFIRWYVNGAQAGETTTVADIPSACGADTFFVVSGDKAATDPAAEVSFRAGTFLAIQEL